VAIASDHHGQAQTLCRKHGLQKAFEMPSLNKQNVEAALPQSRTDLRCITASKAIHARIVGNVPQEVVFVSVKQIHIPIKANFEASFCLINWRCSTCEKNREVHTSRKMPKDRSLILDRM
jgi:hypothetical protein